MNRDVKTLDYTSFDFNEILNELEVYLRETNTFKDFELDGSNIRVLMEILAVIGSQNSFYVHAAANETFLPTARLYKNLNKIAQTLRYSPRGKESATLDVVGELEPEYVFGKKSQYLELPAYSSFPVSTPAKDGSNFVFANVLPFVYLVREYGIRNVEESDITYRDLPLPVTQDVDYFKNSEGAVVIDPSEFSLPLSLNKPLSIIKSNDDDQYRPFDVESYPLLDYASNQSVGQPFTNTIDAQGSSTSLLPNVVYALVLNFVDTTSVPFISIEVNSSVVGDKIEDVIATIILEPTDTSEEVYRMRVVDLLSHNRFYLGVLGLQNLSNVRLDYDIIPNTTNSIEKFKLIIDESGTGSTFDVLINGVIYSLTQDTIESNIIPKDFWDANVEEYNVILSIGDINSPETNYDSSIVVTSKDPVFNQIIIGKINTKYVDPDTGTKTLERSPGNRFGDLKFIEQAQFLKENEQKVGMVFNEQGNTVLRIIFDKEFVADDEGNTNYQVTLTPSANVRTWVTNKSATGFDIYVEPDTGFEGHINWVATRTIETGIRAAEIVFDQPVPPSVTINGEESNYMVQLTPDKNVQVWYENLTPEGFDIKTEGNFEGNISWSIFNYFGDGTIPAELNTEFKQSDTVLINPNSTSEPVTLKLPFNDTGYSIQLVTNENINVWYSEKTTEGFTVNIEPDVTDQVVSIDWYVDNSEGYVFQKHGELNLTGKSSKDLQIPGFRYVNVPETFTINNLLQGQVAFSFINSNTAVDASNNQLNLSIDPTRQYQSDIKFIVNDETVSTNTIRVFVKDVNGIWNEWNRGGVGFDQDIGAGKEVFVVKVNPDKKVEIEFGDGDVWGKSILNRETFILGQQSVGDEGNINKNILTQSVIPSKYILGNDKPNIEFENDLISIIGLKNKEFFENGKAPSTLIDSEGTKLSDTDFQVVQNKNAIGGNEVETVDELRQNAVNNFIGQDRNVSLVDNQSFVNSVFTSNIQTSKVLKYTELRDANIIDDTELEKYWFNHVFVVALNKDGTNVISKSLRDAIVDKLTADNYKMIGTEYEVLPASWVSIDVIVRYKKNNFGSFESIETQMRKNISRFFDPKNHVLGGSIYHSDMITTVNVDFVDSVEVMLNIDRDNVFTANDYNVSLGQGELDEEVARRNKLMTMVRKDPSLVKVYQPLFDTTNNGVRSWDYKLNIDLSDFEFPRLGNVIIEREG